MKFTLKLEYFTLAADISVGNEIIALLGPSGCGKTSILRSIAGLMTPADGFIRLNERTLYSSLDSIDLKPRERNVGLVFQDYALFPHMTVEQNVRYGPENCPSLAGRAVETEEIFQMLKIVHLKHRYPKQLSGGEKQRVALARTLIMRPELLLLDEPLSALDTDTRIELQSELKELQQHWDIPFILVTHDREEAARLGDVSARVRVDRRLHEFKHIKAGASRTV
ncbi:MAG: ABC transporter ATP-binding protein [Candidatus Aquicultor sp.]|nr:ABC transporter ATP-binding protein [Candidatus Aquicultor sp.]